MEERGHQGRGGGHYRSDGQPIRPIAIPARVVEVPVREGDGDGEEDEGDGGEDGAEGADKGFEHPAGVGSAEAAAGVGLDGVEGHGWRGCERMGRGGRIELEEER